jgi:CRP-like cAMP-binding protein
LEESLRLLVADPDLASAIDDPARRRSALRAMTVGRLDLVAGEEIDREVIGLNGTAGLLVLDGFLIRELTTGPGRISADLFGPEDVVQPDHTVPEVAMLPHTVSWSAVTDARVAMLDEDFFARAAQWPEITASLLERAGRFGQRLALRGAIATLQSVDARLLASLWTWASQWATVAGQGVVLKVPLSHERLARLINARRPTVTTAMGRLRGSGLIAQRRDGSWILLSPGPDGDGLERGVAMPALGEITTRSRSRDKQTALTGADARAASARELKVRLEDQRKALRIAAERHRELLDRLLDEAGRLTAASRR